MLEIEKFSSYAFTQWISYHRNETRDPDLVTDCTQSGSGQIHVVDLYVVVDHVGFVIWE